MADTEPIGLLFRSFDVSGSPDCFIKTYDTFSMLVAVTPSLPASASAFSLSCRYSLALYLIGGFFPSQQSQWNASSEKKMTRFGSCTVNRSEAVAGPMPLSLVRACTVRSTSAVSLYAANASRKVSLTASALLDATRLIRVGRNLPWRLMRDKLANQFVCHVSPEAHFLWIVIAIRSLESQRYGLVIRSRTDNSN